MGSCAAPSAKGDDKFITTDYLQQCPLQNPVDGVTAYYGRDSGFRMDSEAREYRSFREAIATESTEEVRFHYVFIDGYWKVMYRTPEGWKMKALALALRRCPK